MKTSELQPGKLRGPFNEDGTVAVPESIDGIPCAYQFGSEKIYVPDDITADSSTVDPGDRVRLEFEPDNPYDKDAVAVYDGAEKLGYLYRGRVKDMVRDFRRDELPIWAHVSGVDDEERSVFLYVAFYRSRGPEAAAAPEFYKEVPAMRKLTREEYQAIEYADGVGLNVPEFVEIREGDECWRPDDITPEENEELARLLLLYQLRQQNTHLEEQNKILEDTYKKTAGIKGWVSFFAFLVIVSLILSFFSWFLSHV